MKTKILNLTAALLVAASLQTHAQGTLLYDQQSTNSPINPIGNEDADGLNIQTAPLTQSFIPTLSAIGFVQFEFEDVPGNGNNGATVYVNLWTGSPNTNSATLIGSTTPVYMPNGFVNSGLGVAGVTNFYFSTLISLTTGQTYYLQPVVQSGDNPWDIVSLTYDAYSSGQLFANGSPFAHTIDMWFREGIDSVPEPSTLAVIGLSGILAYAFKRRSKLFILLGAGALLFGSTYAQTLSVQSTSDSIVQIAADEAGLPTVSASALPRAGTFWVVTPGATSLTALPYPGLPTSLSASPIYSVTANTFLVDASGGNAIVAGNASSTMRRGATATIASTLQAQANTVNNLIEQIQMDGIYPPGFTNGGTNVGFQYNYTPPDYGTNMWLEIENEGTNVLVILHNTSDDQLYQLNSAANLMSTNWDVGDLQWGDWESDQTWFWPIVKIAPMTFYHAHHANAIMQIWNVRDSIEPAPANNDPGQTGIVGIYNGVDSPATNDIKVYYTISGTAQNGIDYSNLTGVATLAAGMQDTNIVIQPIAVGLKPDRTIVLTLVQNSNYLIDTPYLSATNTIYANTALYPIAYGDTEYPCPHTPFRIYPNATDPRALTLTYSIVTWPTHGTLTTNTLPSYVTYESTNCYEGQDSFTFTASDGEFTSAPATVNLFISSGVYANPVTAQTCRGTQVYFYLDGWAYCGMCSYAVLSSPPHGTLDTNWMPYIRYTPTNTSFTGTESFNYRITDECGYSATNTVTITVGDAGITPKGQAVMTGTNQPAVITLSAVDYESCKDNTNYYVYTIISGSTHGTLTGTPPNVTYTPTNGYEGVDFFQFAVSDGVWTNSATITNYVVAGPILMTGCDPFKTGLFVKLDWVLDTAVQQMEQQYNFISDYKIYRASVSGGPYTCIYTNTDFSRMSYTDTNVVAGQTNYYAATFESKDNGTTYESPRSKEIAATGQNPDLIAPDAIWDVWDVSTNHPRTWKGYLPAPFSSVYPNQYPNLYPWPNTNWPAAANGVYSVWSNNIVLVIPTNIVDLSQVKYSIAIDNDYWLYLNNPTNYIDMTNHENNATWAPFKILAPGLHQGTNNISVVIRDRGDITYFSMVVTTNTCGQ